jgi:hypothetical protein
LPKAQRIHIFAKNWDWTGAMLRWFAPLLVFAAKPDVVVRLATAAILCAILAFGVWLISNVALTVDALKNPYVAATYGAVLFCFFVGVGSIAWFRLRRASVPGQRRSLTRAAEPPLPNEVVDRRATEIAKRWDRGGRRAAPPPAKPAARVTTAAAAPAAPLPAALPARMTLTVTGSSYSGKSALIATLVQATGAAPVATNDVIRLVDAGAIDGDEQALAAVVAEATKTDGVLFVVDQDLRAPEVAALDRLIATGKPLYLILNKADQFNAADRDTILVSIRAKLAGELAPANVVAVAGAPSPIEREIEDARGAVRVEVRRPGSDVRALTNLLNRAMPPAPGHVLRFESGDAANA